MQFANGAIKGINLAAMLRNAESAFLDSGAGKTQQTDFSELTGTYTITNGILKNTDLHMQSPLFRVEGAGTVDLPKQMVDYKLTPKAVASAEGQGGQASMSGVAVPVIIQGRFDNLSYKPDLTAAVKGLATDPNAINSLKSLVPGAGGAAPQGSTGGTAPSQPSSNNPVNTLKGLFGSGKSN
jgi:AsmA protein